MKIQKLLVTLCCALSVAFAVQVSAAPVNKDPASDAEAALSRVPIAELPAVAVELVTNAKKKDKEDVALAVIEYTAHAHPGSITPVVSSLAKALPDSAAEIAATAAALVPVEATAIETAVMKAAPSYADAIKRALSSSSSSTVKPVNAPVVVMNNGNRPAVPPGLANGNKEGSIRGNRPAIPPGHVRNPKPGRDQRRSDYARP